MYKQFAQNDTSFAHISKFSESSLPSPFKPFLKTPSTLKVIIDYKPGWANTQSQKQKGMKKLFYETKEFLKEKVEKIESEILALTDDGAACCVSDDKGAYLAKLTEERKDTLDALFQATPNEVMRMDKLNDQLKAITRQMHERVAIVNEDASKIFVDGNFEVEGRLNYNPNAASAIIQLENDDYFGSDFAKIHQVIDMLFDQGYLPIKCADFVRASDLVNDFDDGRWETAYEDWQPQADKFKYINICFAIHSLNAYHPYSIPDILRMNNFDITVTVKKVMTM